MMDGGDDHNVNIVGGVECGIGMVWKQWPWLGAHYSQKVEVEAYTFVMLDLSAHLLWWWLRNPLP